MAFRPSTRWIAKVVLAALAIISIAFAPEPRREPTRVAVARSGPADSRRGPSPLGIAVRVGLGLLVVTATVVQWKEYRHGRE